MSTYTAPASTAQAEFHEFMGRCHAALEQQTKGHSQPFLALWSHSPDVTVMAAVGGYQSGFDDVSGLLSHVSKSLNWETFDVTTLASAVAGDFAFTVELERLTRTVDDEEQVMTLRATQVYRQVDGTWMVVHRHGDLLTPYEEKW